MVIMCGVISITDFSSFLTIRFTVHTWEIIRYQDFYLGVKGVELKQVGAFECFCVDLLKSDPVELALKDVDLLIYYLRIVHMCANWMCTFGTDELMGCL